ncbi:MAG: hypothetical protein ACFN4S_08660, partial [Prevotella conceptionensis]
MGTLLYNLVWLSLGILLFGSVACGHVPMVVVGSIDVFFFCRCLCVGLLSQTQWPAWLGHSGRLVGTNYFYYFCTMELFKQLASLMLPSQILDYFDVV